MLLKALTLNTGQESPRKAKQVALLSRSTLLLSLPECKLAAAEEELLIVLHLNMYSDDGLACMIKKSVLCTVSIAVSIPTSPRTLYMSCVRGRHAAHPLCVERMPSFAGQRSTACGHLNALNMWPIRAGQLWLPDNTGSHARPMCVGFSASEGSLYHQTAEMGDSRQRNGYQQRQQQSCNMIQGCES